MTKNRTVLGGYSVTASAVEVGDMLVVGGGDLSHVDQVRTLWLAEPTTGAVITTSDPANGHRWPVVHILTQAGGIVRFPHEHVTVYR